MAVLEVFGPQLGRPRVVWRFTFAFDPKRAAIVLCGGDKSGGGERRFYRQLIAKADGRFDTYLADLKAKETKKRGKQRS